MSSNDGKKKRPLVPQLRFPEFREELSTLPLATVADLVSDKISISQLTSRQYVSTENLLPDFGGMNPSTKLPSVSFVTFFQPNDILVSNIRPYLKKVCQSKISGGASNDVLVFRAKKHVNADYLSAILRSDLFIDYVMRGAKGVKMPRGEVSMIQQFPVIYLCPEEQQKISDCLSSLDDLITLEAKKLEALKTHKKGLMQQLFPREGETVPRLRFPEFREAGKWEYYFGNKLFDQISNTNHNSDLPVLAITQEHGAIPRDMIDYHVSVTKKSLEVYKVVEVGDFIISLRSFQGGIEYSNHHGICSPAYVILRLKSQNVAHYFKYLFKTDRFISQLNKNIEGLRDGKMISYKQFSELRLPVSSFAEQQKIADCLSSLDDLITSQAQKVELLKRHKKGLIQRLFPVLDESQG
jgi:type I restriction enzyme S subunit